MGENFQHITPPTNPAWEFSNLSHCFGFWQFNDLTWDSTGAKFQKATLPSNRFPFFFSMVLTGVIVFDF